MFNSSLTQRGDRFIADDVKYYFDIWFGVVTTDCLTTLSIVSNVINLSVFRAQGLQERVNFTLFCLSFSDLMGAVFVTTMSVGFLSHVQILSVLVESSSYIIYLSWYRTMFVDLSTALTVFIAIERCSCVTRPLQFNTSFIARHGRAIVVVIILFILANYLPLLTTFGYETITKDETNLSLITVTYPEINIAVQQFNDLVLGVALAAYCQIVIFVCAVLMYRGLQNSSRVRTKVMGTADHLSIDGGLSNKERRVVKMVLILACLYMVSALPQIVFCWARLLIPDIPQNVIGNLHLTLGAIIYFTAATYGAFSIFIYHNFSSNFRAVLYNNFIVRFLTNK